MVNLPFYSRFAVVRAALRLPSLGGPLDSERRGNQKPGKHLGEPFADSEPNFAGYKREQRGGDNDGRSNWRVEQHESNGEDDCEGYYVRKFRVYSG
jgi:hypothetical protein